MNAPHHLSLRCQNGHVRRILPRLPGCAIVTILAILLWAVTAWPCATSFQRAAERVLTKSEEALIVWDEARHTEHFIREALFDTRANSFGFIVPVPGRPVLAEADDFVFYGLRDITDPERVYNAYPSFARGVELTCLPKLLTTSDDWEGAPNRNVSVLEEKRVAGLDATVLAASDVEGLTSWLSDRGFELRESLKRWIAVYVAKGWYFVAFRYQHDEAAPSGRRSGDGDGIASRAVRITFSTDNAVYPYLEPDDVPSQPGRSLTLFVLSTAATKGELADERARPWEASVSFSAPILSSSLNSEHLPGLELPARPWLSRFDDFAEKRPYSDVVFRPSASTAEVRPSSVHLFHPGPVYIPVELPFGAAGLVWWWRRGARRRARDPRRS